MRPCSGGRPRSCTFEPARGGRISEKAPGADMRGGPSRPGGWLWAASTPRDVSETPVRPHDKNLNHHLPAILPPRPTFAPQIFRKAWNMNGARQAHPKNLQPDLPGASARPRLACCRLTRTASPPLRPCGPPGAATLPTWTCIRPLFVHGSLASARSSSWPEKRLLAPVARAQRETLQTTDAEPPAGTVVLA